MSDVELKPCPFCGGKGILHSKTHMSYVKCQTCGAETGLVEVSANTSLEEIAVKAWNGRADNG